MLAITRSPGLLWAPAALVAAVTGILALLRPESMRLTDLQVYLGALDTLQAGGSLYDYIRNGNAPFTYPPFAALVLLIPARLPAEILFPAWTLGTALATVALARLFNRRAAPWIAVLLMLSAPISSNFRYGQVSLLLALLVTTDVLALRSSRFQGVLIGLAAAVKLTPLIFIPMLWLTGRRRAAALATATFLACTTVGALLLPHDSWRYWSGEVHDVARLGFITSVGNQSLNGALLRLDVPHRALLATALAAAIAAVALWRTTTLHDPRTALVVTGAAGIVLSPVSWTHHQVWLVLAAFLPLSHLARATVLTVMIAPVTALTWAPLRESRLLLAIALALLLTRPNPAPPVADPWSRDTGTPEVTGRPLMRRAGGA
ncbi:glycosyltransferase 87 family protein [Actinoplanes sp. NPDC024001]|uniref:glycosyltransferase 87 family protein n=1 Tax=Actinoplanes sp. NPDC024001 TaxID=3154598 RepID=UPI0033CAC03D